jgi:CubicO group peptidase (beta-lactamase class C family)
MAQSKTFIDTLQRIDQLFSKWNTLTPGGVITISRNGEILYQKAFGMADLEHAVINFKETVFEAGSISKQFTAVAVLLLVQEGKISLKDDIRKYFPDFPDYGIPIFVENLLHHTSGLRDWGSVISLSGWPRGTRVYTPEHVKEIIWRQKELNFKPGTAYGYSNSNYNMLVFLVEKVTSQSFQQFTRERLFIPAGMMHTQWRDNYKSILPERAIAYSKSENQYVQNMPFENTFGHGGLLTTAGDLECWNKRWSSRQFGEEINRLQKTKVKLTNGKEINYACGVSVRNINGSEEISHSGATAGYRAWMAWYPENKLSVVYLSNDGSVDPDFIGSSIAEIFLGKETRKTFSNLSDPVSLSNERLNSFAGLFKNIRGEDIIELELNKDSLRFKNVPAALVPVSQNSFYFPGFTINFPSDLTKYDRLLLQNPEKDTGTYIRVHAFNPDERTLQEYIGFYYSEEADARVAIKVIDGKLWIIRSGDERIPLKPVFTDAFFDNDQNLFQLIRDKKKKISGLLVSIPRARNILFTKE